MMKIHRGTTKTTKIEALRARYLRGPTLTQIPYFHQFNWDFLLFRPHAALIIGADGSPRHFHRNRLDIEWNTGHVSWFESGTGLQRVFISPKHIHQFVNFRINLDLAVRTGIAH